MTIRIGEPIKEADIRQMVLWSWHVLNLLRPGLRPLDFDPAGIDQTTRRVCELLDRYGLNNWPARSDQGWQRLMSLDDSSVDILILKSIDAALKYYCLYPEESG